MKVPVPIVFLATTLGVGLLLFARSSHAQCIDYSEYLHRAGGIDTPDILYDVVVSGGFAYVAGDSGLSVADLSDPVSPVIVGSVGTPDGARGVAVSGCTVYIVGEFGLCVVDVCDPTSPVILGCAGTPSTSVYDVEVSGSYAYVAGSSGLHVLDISNPTFPEMVGGLSSSAGANDVALSGSYAFVADSTGLQVVNISDPELPEIVGSLGTQSTTRGVAVSGNYAYITVAWPSSTFEVVDVHDPASPTTVGSIVMAGRKVAVSGSHAYVITGFTFRVVDVSIPESPAAMEVVSLSTYGLAVSGDHAFVAGLKYFAVLDISNPTPPPPPLVSEVDFRVGDLTVSGNYAYVVDCTDTLNCYNSGASRFMVVDISAAPAFAVVGDVEGPETGTMRAVAVSGSHAYVAGNIRGACAPVSVPFEDRTAPRLQDLPPSHPFGPRAVLYVFDVSDRTSPVRSGYCCLGEPGVYVPCGYLATAEDVAVSGDYAYVAALPGLHVVDISSPSSPTAVSSVALSGLDQRPICVAVSEDYAYVVSTKSVPEPGDWPGCRNWPPTRLEVVDVRDPASPVWVGSTDMPGDATGVAVSGSYAYVAGKYYNRAGGAGEAGLRVVDVANPTSPEIVQVLEPRHSFQDVVATESYVYASGQIWRVPSPDDPTVRDVAQLSSRSRSAAISGDYVYVEWGGYLGVYPAQCPPTAPARFVVATDKPGHDRQSRLHLAIPVPNPTSTGTVLSFSLPDAQRTRLTLYDVAGRRIRTLVNTTLTGGNHSVTWDARDHTGRRVAPGTYFVRLTAGEVTQTRKVVFLGGR